MKALLRPMEPGDVPHVAAIDRVSFPTPWPPSAFRSEIKRASATYLVLSSVVEETSASDEGGTPSWFRRFLGVPPGSRIIGYVGFRVQSAGGHITTIAVQPDWRGRGLGEFLLVVALNRMASSSVQKVTLEMRPSNDVAFALYRKYGFEVETYRRGYYRDGEDAWVMALDLVGRAYRRKLERRRREVHSRLDEQDIDVGQMDGAGL